MLRNALLAITLIPLLFGSCKKESDAPDNQFIINGIHDVSLGSAGGNTLVLSVAQTSGTQERVTISVTGLPAGVTAVADPASGSPAFTSTVVFTQSIAAVAGTYPIKVTGSSASYTRSYDLNLTVPALNGFVFDGKTYQKSSMSRSTSGGFSMVNINSSDNGGGNLNAYIMGSWPVANGTYTYPIGGSASNSMDIMIGTGAGSWSTSGPTGIDATVTINNGKMTISASGIPLLNGAETKLLTILASE